MAEGAPLLREYVGKTCIEGSNPSDSASLNRAQRRLLWIAVAAMAAWPAATAN